MVSGGIVLLLSKGNSSKILVFSEELFFIYLLPPIIFDAVFGFQVKKRQFFKNFWTILLFGVLCEFEIGIKVAHQRSGDEDELCVFYVCLVRYGNYDQQPKDVDPLNVTAMACPALPLCPRAIAEAERGIPDKIKRV